ncbi:MAG: class I SAM-dependent methyltransferase [bacterium]
MTSPPPSPSIYDPAFVKDVFDRCSEKYILFSYFCSFGFTERWRRQAVDHLPLPDNQALTGYDLMAGTGEVWPHITRRFPKIKTITAVDISKGMHERALARIKNMNNHKISFRQDNVLDSQLPDNSCDFIISTFGLKTFNQAQHLKLAQLVNKVLRPGGTFSFIEASDPKGWWLRPLYKFHLNKLLPLIEKIFLNGAQDFAMIGAYSHNFGNAQNFTAQLKAAGLEVEYKTYFFGCATGVIGRKPK